MCTPNEKSLKFGQGFTLAELLIALAILGVIATFTIPKILAAQANQQFLAIAKDDIGMVAGAFQQAQNAGSLSSGTKIGDLTQYMNFVRYDTSSSLDNVYSQSNFDCSSSNPCLFLHNGSALHYGGSVSFAGTATTNAIWFHVDPDGVYSGTTNGNGKAVGIFIYYNGKMADEGNIAAGTTNSSGSYSANASKVPTWFQW